MAADFITYEQPLNEPIRICLRLEHLFEQLHSHLKQPTTADSHLAMIALLKTLNVIDRPDLKPKLTQTLTQQVTALAQLEHSPQVDKLKLQDLLHRLDTMIEHLHQTHGKIGENLRQNVFLNQIRLHLHNPAGPCGFNTPGYSLWLHQSADKRMADLTRWSQEFDQLKAVVNTILFITRDCAASQSTVAQQGLYQQTLDANLPCQLIRVKIPANAPLYPEISAGIHRLVIRFLPLDTHRATPIPPTTENVNFILFCCRV